MERIGRAIDRVWLNLASVKLTLVVFVALLLLAIPGTVVLQSNISNVDPGLQYDYAFWSFGQFTQLFTAYHSFWYVGLIALLALNLIACSVERWPQMFRMATQRPVRWSKETFAKQSPEYRQDWKSSLPKEVALKKVLHVFDKKFQAPQILEDGPDSFQVFWQTGRWSRVANYLVHTSLLVIFAGAIVAALYGFEGAANIPAGAAVDTFLLFKEGKGSGLQVAEGGLPNERLFGFRLEAESFDVNFYEDYPGRPKDFISKLNVLEQGEIKASKVIRVNDPMTYKNFVFYQSSYGRMGDFQVRFRVVDKKAPLEKQKALGSKMGLAHEIKEYGVTVVPVRASLDVQSLGPGVQFQEMKNGRPAGEAFWVLRDYPQFDLERRKAPYGLILDDLRELYFTGLQIGYDPGAPIYWLGCFGMLLGTFYALFVKHKKFYLRFDRGEFELAGTIHRLPMGFEKEVAHWAEQFKLAVSAKGVHPNVPT